MNKAYVMTGAGLVGLGVAAAYGRNHIANGLSHAGRFLGNVAGSMKDGSVDILNNVWTAGSHAAGYILDKGGNMANAYLTALREGDENAIIGTALVSSLLVAEGVGRLLERRKLSAIVDQYKVVKDTVKKGFSDVKADDNQDWSKFGDDLYSGRKLGWYLERTDRGNRPSWYLKAYELDDAKAHTGSFISECEQKADMSFFKHLPPPRVLHGYSPNILTGIGLGILPGITYLTSGYRKALDGFVESENYEAREAYSRCRTDVRHKRYEKQREIMDGIKTRIDEERQKEARKRQSEEDSRRYRSQRRY